MNRKSNIPVTLLVVGTIAIVIIALIVFNNKRDELDSGMNYFRNIEVLNNVQNDMQFYNYNNKNSLSVLYPDIGLIKKVFDYYSNYYPVFEQIKIENEMSIEKGNVVIKLPINPTK